MALVAHKYMTEEMSEEELRATFAARGHTLDFLVDRLREQTHSKTLTSFLITGPRGAGKTTLVLMLCSRIQEDGELANAWLSIRFPEELQGISSLRDLLSASLLRLLEDHGIAAAKEWHERAESEMNDEQSLELAITGLRQISAQTGKRMILFIENLDQVFDRKLDEGAQATLRRLLMVDPFLMMVGTSVRMFEAVQNYQEPFFNYFSRVPLDRLDDGQVYQVLLHRARYDGSDDFQRQYREHKPKIQAITRLTGGNPRLLLLLYEVLSEGRLGQTVSALRQVVDELTPLLKDVLENQFTEQQSKILDALMCAGGTAKPTDIATSSRLSLNTVTTQLQRLKEMQVVEVRGGGKGRAAYYSVPDPLFRTWYQLRYLRPNKRRIEIFVDVLKAWFEAEERLNMLQKLARQAVGAEGKTARDHADTAEYFAASLEGSPLAPEAETEMVRTLWHTGGMREAAFALSDLVPMPESSEGPQEADAYAKLSTWCLAHGQLDQCLEAARAAVEKSPDNLTYQINYGLALALSGDHSGAFACFDAVAKVPHATSAQLAQALLNRGVSKGILGNAVGAIKDCTRVVEMPDASPDLMAHALYNRGVRKEKLGDTADAIEDYTRVAQMEDTPTELVAKALNNRGVCKGRLGAMVDATKDHTRVVKMEGAPPELVSQAFYNRGVSKGMIGDSEGAIEDYTRVVEMEDAPPDCAAKALNGRAVAKGKAGNHMAAYHDFSTSLSIKNVSPETRVQSGIGILQASLALGDVAKLSEAALLLSRSLAGSSEEDRSKVYMGILLGLSRPRYRDHWASVWRALVSVLPDDRVRRGLEQLAPVADVLETGDRAKLDPLPPEQREFAEEVLKKFDADAGGASDAGSESEA